ncbi:hypothetical protein BECP10_00012 [Escherichia phage vB_EcoS-BECP10]|uniref:Uncharacterized protein n=1 Tax=Escherichia phage vB_EcoS-BECP10 TaxID=2797407 RepID=A0A7T7GTZ3_9CAUD|nr:hypothetical protein BECP10_00012 [Escherichia phage vB_EcoS-BECP10]
MINFKEAATEIMDFERELIWMGHNMTNLEIANQIWHSKMNPQDRLEVMNIVGEVKGSALMKLRACHSYIAKQL